MPVVTNAREIFMEIPSGYPEPGKTTVYDTSETIDLECPLDGGFLVKTLYLAIEPVIKGRMRDAKVYGPWCYSLDSPIDNYGVGIVLRSENSEVKLGDHVYGFLPFQQYFIRKDLANLEVLKNEENLPWTVYLGVCGMPGQTAYYGWKEYASPTKGETVFVTTGSGTVGATVIQLAKRDGLKVIACAGSDDKVEWIKSIGADVAFNYKTQGVRETLKEHRPINIYWDNVGGETLEAALDNAATGARFIECGMISGYNTSFKGITNLFMVIAKEIKMCGFIVSSLRQKHQEAFNNEIPRLVANGEIKYLEDREWGLEHAGEALLAVMKGGNRGKKIIVLAEE